VCPRMEGESTPQFNGWLQGIVRQFSALSSQEQTTTLTELISCCGSDQLWHLQQKLPDFLYRDFIQLLPPEIAEKILTYLCPASLLTSCQVSRVWNKRISGMNALWRQKCRMIGCHPDSVWAEDVLMSDLKLEPELQLPTGVVSPSSKLHCIKGLRLRQELCTGSAWQQEGLVNLVKPPGRFSALHHHRGHIAGGTADSSHTLAIEESGESVVIWTVQDNRVAVSFPVSGSVSCIKLEYPSLVVCGHFDGTLSAHQVSGVGTGSSKLTHAEPSYPNTPGKLLQKFRLHTAPVLSLDFDIDEDVLVSGSADCSTKIWELSSGRLLKTLASQSHWVLSVIFASHLNQWVPCYKGRQLLLIMTRDDIQLYTWHPDRPSDPEDNAIKASQEETSQNPERETEEEIGGKTANVQEPKEQQIKLKDLADRDLYIPLKSVTDAIQSFFFTPGLHFDGRNISFVRQIPMFDTQTIGDADIVTVDAGSSKLVGSVHINQKIRKLLAIGRRFAVILLPFADSKYKNLAIVDLQKREVIGGCTVPHSRASTPDFSQVSIGETSWLDGFSEGCTRGLVACMALADSSIHTVIWTNKDQETESCDEPRLVRTGSKW